MNLQLWPYVMYQGNWSIPYPIMTDLWEQLVINNKVQQLFYDGGINAANEFIGFMQEPNRFLVLGCDMDSKKIIAFGMLSNLHDGTAYVHFSFVERFKEGVGEAVINFWRDLPNGNGEKLVDVLVGITPESFEPVLKIIQIWGFKIIGKIPKICKMAYKGGKEDGVISYLVLGG